MWRERMRAFTGKLSLSLSWKMLFFIVLGAGICSFGIHNIHQRTAITEGGVIGAMLLAEHWLGDLPGVYHSGAGSALLCAGRPVSGASLPGSVPVLDGLRVAVLQAVGTVSTAVAGSFGTTACGSAAGRCVRRCRCRADRPAGRLQRR